MGKREPFSFLVTHHQAKCIKRLLVGDNIRITLFRIAERWSSPLDRGGNLNNYRGLINIIAFYTYYFVTLMYWLLNNLSPKGDQHQISPCNINDL